MVRLVLTLLFISISGSSFAQGTKSRFVMAAIPDHSWNLLLEKNNTYKYIHWSAWDLPHTLDSGFYSIQANKLTLQSQVSDSLNVTYEMKETPYQKNEYIPPPFRLKKSLWGPKAIRLIRCN